MSTATGVNRVILLGELGSEVIFNDENQSTGNYSFSLITREMVRKGSEKLPHNEKHQIKAPNVLITPILAELQKGCKIYLEGRAETTSSIDHQGIRRYNTCIYATKIELPDLAIAG